MSDEVRRDGAVLATVIALLDAKTPLDAWPSEASQALAKAMATDAGNAGEFLKAQRLVQHLFVGAPPGELVETSATACRRAERLRADLADLTPYGAGLHLLNELA